MLVSFTRTSWGNNRGKETQSNFICFSTFLRTLQNLLHKWFESPRMVNARRKTIQLNLTLLALELAKKCPRMLRKSPIQWHASFCRKKKPWEDTGYSPNLCDLYYPTQLLNVSYLSGFSGGDKHEWETVWRKGSSFWPCFLRFQFVGTGLNCLVR